VCIVFVFVLKNLCDLSILFSSHALHHIRLQHNAPTIPHCRYLRFFSGL
jgi:hypothetical protein